jgi:putative tricarboxylic transport membrane protein
VTEAPQGRAALRQRSSELAVAALLFCLGAIVVADSLRLGASWADDGPQAGYFPFYVGALICLASAVNAVRALAMAAARNGTFVEVGALRLVCCVLVPTAIYAASIEWLGIYVASAAFVAGFMRWLGRDPWWKVAAVALGSSAAFFAIFELWFKVPLPKGPLESLLGLG